MMRQLTRRKSLIGTAVIVLAMVLIAGFTSFASAVSYIFTLIFFVVSSYWMFVWCIYCSQIVFIFLIRWYYHIHWYSLAFSSHCNISYANIMAHIKNRKLLMQRICVLPLFNSVPR